MLMRLHHCIGDGLALGHVLLSMTDRVPWMESHAVPRALAVHELPDLGGRDLGEDDHTPIVSVIRSVL